MGSITVTIDDRIATKLGGVELSSMSSEVGMMITDRLGPIGLGIESMRDDGDDLNVAELQQYVEELGRIAEAIKECQKTLQPDGTYA
jgi:hypothetical protein